MLRFTAGATVAALALAAVLASPGRAQAPSTAELGRARAIAETFFTKLQDATPEEALDYLTQNPSLARKRDEIEKARAQLLGVFRLLGEYHGRELLAEKSLGSRFVHVTYLAYFDRQPLRIRFELYKAKDDWVIQNFNFDDEYIKELRDAATRQYLQ